MEAAAIQHIPLRAIFAESRVIAFSEDADRDNVLRELVNTIAASGKLAGSKIDSIVEALARREAAGSTGIGRCLAFPHMRTAAVTEHVGAIAMTPEGIDFDSLDGSPTRLIFLLLSPLNAPQEHTDIMGRLARLISDQTLQYILRIPRSAENLFRILDF